MITNSSSPKRGDIWLTNFDPTVGAEIKMKQVLVTEYDFR
ncbi:MAG: type II toxin-antitoxin system PemK/MazF family toxin [Aphanizomenon gracile PMC649.10]|nr:type II toxin-antitoxin system PemK/MazF family toxin [Dolichospermum sp. LEGE 00240]MDM3847326.1 type II toxin-antitoxin system PemK/MazF family toxin [Aphanizomenon gracile PMC638.10]MDM3853478.1 type II toxin-antitoxin system PemK/MazF family toxin [Aphanizomenon gracile PMC649.10]MDM3859399.1 type II toxin-antitoxin system PemK/MazF family toxin [Aphanizomenon gracile PMC644.10]